MSESLNRTGAVIPAYTQGDVETYGFTPGRFAGGVLYISGQPGSNENGEIPDGTEEQIHNVFRNMRTVVEEAGLSMDDVVNIVSHHVGDVADTFEAFVRIKTEYFNAPFPTWTSFGVASLADPKFVIEVSAVAHVPAAAD
jgi:enamine deaminase RidA (YjgF/YER057c/UK114 family)